MKVAVGTMFPAAGNWCWAPNEDSPERIILGLPRVGVVRIKVARGEDPGLPQTWGWNGDTDRPTLYPSIDTDADAGRVKWHGHLVDGVLKEV